MSMSRPSKAKSSLMQVLPNRLLQLAEANGGMANLARLSGVGQSSLSRCLKGAEISLSSAGAICEAAGVSVDWLIGNGKNVFEGLQIPFYDIHASAGYGSIPSEDEVPSQIISMPKGLLRATPTSVGHLCAILAQGDSMEPTIQSGSLLIVDRSKSYIHEGIFVIRQNDGLLVKRVQQSNPRTITLRSDNAQYEPINIKLDDPSQRIAVFGKVIWAGQEL